MNPGYRIGYFTESQRSPQMLRDCPKCPFWICSFAFRSCHVCQSLNVYNQVRLSSLVGVMQRSYSERTLLSLTWRCSLLHGSSIQGQPGRARASTAAPVSCRGFGIVCRERSYPCPTPSSTLTPPPAFATAHVRQRCYKFVCQDSRIHCLLN
jgi:hypothetical protein